MNPADPAGMPAGGVGVGLVQASPSGAGAVLPPNRFATGSGPLNMSRQIATGVAVLVAILVTHPDLHGFGHSFEVVAVFGLLGALAAALLRRPPVPVRTATVPMEQRTDITVREAARS